MQQCENSHRPRLHWPVAKQPPAKKGESGGEGPPIQQLLPDLSSHCERKSTGELACEREEVCEGDRCRVCVFVSERERERKRKAVALWVVAGKKARQPVRCYTSCTPPLPLLRTIPLPGTHSVDYSDGFPLHSSFRETPVCARQEREKESERQRGNSADLALKSRAGG